MKSFPNPKTVSNKAALQSRQRKDFRGDSPVNPQPSRGRALLILGMLLTGFILIHCALPLASTIKIGADEDFALSKALLSLKGYKMYIDFWNDQPPLHTFLLKLLFKHVSFSVLAARIMTVVAALMLLTALFVLVRHLNGLAVATLATLLLIASPGFVELSASAMVELPGLAPVVAVICVIQIKKGRLFDALAGIIFAVALQIKLIEALYCPIIAMALWLRHRQSSSPWAEWGKSIACFGTAGIATFLAIHFIVDEAIMVQIAQSRASHFSSVRYHEYGSPKDYPFDWSILAKYWDAMIPLLTGLWLLAFRKLKFAPVLLPLAWLIWTFAVFTTFKPWWTYYFVHTAVPLCWMAAIGIVGIWQAFQQKKRTMLAVLIGVYVAGASTWMIARVYLQIRDIGEKPRTYFSPVLSEIRRFKPLHLVHVRQ